MSESDPALDPALEARVRAWLAIDPDPTTRAELEGLLAGGERRDEELADRFDQPLAFGTGGIRGQLGAGPGRMNRVVVRRAVAGLVAHLGGEPLVVVGHDARRGSAEFALDAAGVVAAAGGRAVLLAPHVPTPLLAFAVRHLGADAGVMCTASHNPATDNGIKVYLGDGAQVIPPIDAAIAAAIDAAGPDAVVVAEPGHPGIERAGPDVAEAYVAHAAGLLAPGPRQLRIAYTPLHGVGLEVTAQAFGRAGFAPLEVVAEQAAPDGAFPTTMRPNPEEPEALAHLRAQAQACGADLALAHDPDADRLGVLVPRDGGWVALRGDQIGALLADHLLTTTTGADRLVVDTVLSSGLLGKIAAAHGVHHERTLPGFKWLVRPAMEHPELRFTFAYEDALGFSVDGAVRDKDGITAGLVVADLVAGLKERGLTVWDRLEALARAHGLHAIDVWSVPAWGLGAHRRARADVAALRAEPPESLGGRRVVQVVDLAAGVRGLPPADVVVLGLDGGAWVSVRPSGTEPTVKVHSAVVVPVVGGPGAYADAELVASAQLADIHRALVSGFRGGWR
jgi:phosphomannomutase